MLSAKPPRQRSPSWPAGTRFSSPVLPDRGYGRVRSRARPRASGGRGIRARAVGRRVALVLTVLLALLLSAGCDVFSPSRLTDTPAPLPTAPQPRRAAVILPSATPLPPTAAPTPTREPAAFINRQRARVVRVWDGQSILIDNGLTVRYLGLQAPGAGVLNRAAQPFGREAAQRNAELVEGKEVDLEQDVTDVDANGQLPRYVYVDGLFVNEDIVLAGLANAAPRPPD